MRLLRRLILFLLILFLPLAGFALFLARRSFPDLNGEVRVPGLEKPVTILRDAHGIPNIYASTQHDLFFAQGYVHAQDRFWQMDFWRHTGSGRLSEMFGESQVHTDQVLRTMGWARVVQADMQRTDPVSMSILRGYSDGVNAYIQERGASKLALEYVILNLINREYRIEPWEPLHSLTWGKAMAWDLGSNMYSEISRSVLLKSLGSERLADLYPPYPGDRPLILPAATVSLPGPGISLRRPAESGPALPDYILAGLRLIAPEPHESIGSNNWVISGALTATGKPILANDPHLGEQMPSIWYQVGLHCEPRTAECPYDVAGFSFAGVPGIVIGHNDRIAWGFTNVGPDVQDLFIEKTNPENPDQYEAAGTWVDMEKITETIRVAGGSARTVVVRKTKHGPVMSDVFSALENFASRSGGSIPERYAIALEWTALEPSVTFPAIWKLNLARNWEDFRKAASEFDVPSQNMIYADVDGNIGYQVPGMIPIRKSGDGRLPAPGWTGEYDWAGYIPFEELPFSYNPASGYIATANNAVVDASYPYLLGSDWDYGSRAQRIVDMIEANRGHISIDTVREMQGDDKNLNAQQLVPYLLKLRITDSRLAQARALLEGWDYQQRMDLAAPALFECFWKHLLDAAFHDDLPADYWPGGGNRWVEVVRRLAQEPESSWWDDRRTGQKETRDDILLKALTAAVDELEASQGKDPSAWRWGRMHTVTFENETLGRSGVRAVERMLNRGPYETSGGSAVVNATAWNAVHGYEVTDLPSMRMIVDLGNLENSLAIHTTGQSGHAYHANYIDMAEDWRQIRYLPFRFGQSSVQSAATKILKLLPE